MYTTTVPCCIDVPQSQIAPSHGICCTDRIDGEHASSSSVCVCAMCIRVCCPRCVGLRTHPFQTQDTCMHVCMHVCIMCDGKEDEKMTRIEQRLKHDQTHMQARAVSCMMCIHRLCDSLVVPRVDCQCIDRCCAPLS